MGKKFCLAFLGIFLCGLCVLSAGAAFAAMSDGEFFELCENGTPRQVEEAIKAGANVHARDEYGQTPLFFAAFGNPNHEVTTALIKAGADVNAKDEEGLTPLMQAALYNSNHKVIIALIKAGADVNAGTENGTTPIIFAAFGNSDPEAIIALIKAGANVHAKDTGDKRAIDYAKENQNIANTEAYRMLEGASK